MTRAVVAVCGLRAEARIAAGPGVVTVIGGGRGDGLVDDLERAIAAGAAGLVSFGIAGSLAPGPAAGTLLVARAVVASDARYATDPAWSDRLIEATGAREGTIAGVDVVVAEVADKAALRKATGADAVDMESQVVARVARSHGLPFTVLRAVADGAGHALPHAATVAMRPDGRIDLGAVLRSLAARPAQLPSLLRLARETRAASGALRRGRARLGPGLDHLDLRELLVDVV